MGMQNWESRKILSLIISSPWPWNLSSGKIVISKEPEDLQKLNSTTEVRTSSMKTEEELIKVEEAEDLTIEEPEVVDLIEEAKETSIITELTKVIIETIKMTIQCHKITKQ